MSTILDEAACGAAAQVQQDGLLPVSPFTALQFHFGMLLGVDDLETSQAYPRGKIRLHNGWLHREGVVWGMKVSFNTRKEVVVDPGLALDAAGHELHLDTQACLDLGKWYEKNKDDPSFTFTDDGAGGKNFTAHIVAKFKACLTRPVPAIADPCAGAETDTAYSRAFETVDLLLRPNTAPIKERPYHRLRVLFQLEDPRPLDPVDRDVKALREHVQSRPPAEQPAAYLEAFRKLAALEEIDLSPQTTPQGERNSIFPEDPTEVVLADVSGIHVKAHATLGWVITDPIPTPDVTVRPSHVATATIEELLCGPLFTAGGAGAAPAAAPAPAPAPAPPPAPSPPPAAGSAPAPLVNPDGHGPRFDRLSVSLPTNKSVTLVANGPLDAASVGPAAFSVSTYNATDGWSTVEIHQATLDSQTLQTVTIDLRERIVDALVRVIAYGTGPTPLLGTNMVPLAGATDSPSGSIHDGNDFVHMYMLRRTP
jgi:hypothetical protein